MIFFLLVNNWFESMGVKFEVSQLKIRENMALEALIINMPSHIAPVVVPWLVNSSSCWGHIWYNVYIFRGYDPSFALGFHMGTPYSIHY